MDNKNRQAFWYHENEQEVCISSGTDYHLTFEDILTAMQEKIDQLEKRVSELEADKILLEDDNVQK